MHLVFLPIKNYKKQNNKTVYDDIHEVALPPTQSYIPETFE